MKLASNTLLATSISLASLLASNEAACQATNLDGGLAGVNGIPLLAVEGVLVNNTFVPGENVDISLSNAEASVPGTLVIGFSLINYPIFGGILMPSPDLEVPFETDANGQWAFSFPTTDPLPPVYVQTMVIDSAAPMGVALSNTFEFVVGADTAYYQMEDAKPSNKEKIEFDTKGTGKQTIVSEVMVWCPPVQGTASPPPSAGSEAWDDSDPNITTYTRVASPPPGNNEYFLSGTDSDPEVQFNSNMPTGCVVRVGFDNAPYGFEVNTADWK